MWKSLLALYAPSQKIQLQKHCTLWAIKVNIILLLWTNTVMYGFLFFVNLIAFCIPALLGAFGYPWRMGVLPFYILSSTWENKYLNVLQVPKHPFLLFWYHYSWIQSDVWFLRKCFPYLKAIKNTADNTCHASFCSFPLLRMIDIKKLLAINLSGERDLQPPNYL